MAGASSISWACTCALTSSARTPVSAVRTRAKSRAVSVTGRKGGERAGSRLEGEGTYRQRICGAWW
ncbi:hypothetical protein B484DRAFT_236729 [Ochromonadaceae sp. CCMP2298]|nr:hypothetical protein B484DRAFT_236729 [Ochromonadaceae sp. CCMP2298]